MNDDQLASGSKKGMNKRSRAAPDDSVAFERFSKLVDGYLETGGKNKINKYSQYIPVIKRLLDHGVSERGIYDLVRKAEVGMSRDIMKQIIQRIKKSGVAGEGGKQSMDPDGPTELKADVSEAGGELNSTEGKIKVPAVADQDGRAPREQRPSNKQELLDGKALEEAIVNRLASIAKSVPRNFE